MSEMVLQGIVCATVATIYLQEPTHSDRPTATDKKRPTHSDDLQQPTHSDSALDRQQPTHSVTTQARRLRLRIASSSDRPTDPN